MQNSRPTKKAEDSSDKQQTAVCLTSAYLAPVEYFCAIATADTVLIEKYDSYVKQTYRNRCRIATANGVLSLSIPVEKKSGEKILMRDVRISEHSDWQVHHWRSIESAYNSTPFFEFYKDDFIPFYEKNWTFLWDFNFEIQLKVLELLELEPIICFTDTFEMELKKAVVDLRENIHPKINGEKDNFKPYYQVFEERFGFVSNLSIIDLIFNMGNESQLIIHN